MSATYANPLAGASVRAERIDAGVDYAGTGTVGAIARGVITKVVPAAQAGWDGGDYVEYKVTQPGPLFGRSIYVAEGIAPDVKVGQRLNAGDPIARLIPGSSTGIETGWASGGASDTALGQFDGTHSTAAGKSFSDLISSLGGPAGVPLAGPVTGNAPAGTGSVASNVASGFRGGTANDPFTTRLDWAGQQTANDVNAVAGAVGAAKKSVDVIGAIGDFISNPIHGILTVALVIAGAGLMYTGVKQLSGSAGAQEAAS